MTVSENDPRKCFLLRMSKREQQLLGSGLQALYDKSLEMNRLEIVHLLKRLDKPRGEALGILEDARA